MCDYSLHAVESRPAVVGEELVVHRFSITVTRAMVNTSEPDVAVCLLPGTQVVFEKPVQVEWDLASWIKGWFTKKPEPRRLTAAFVKVDPDRVTAHHDAFEFSIGDVVSVQRLRRGQKLKVLQLPAPQILVNSERQASLPQPRPLPTIT